MNDLPTGTVSFLFTDIEGSTRRWEHHHEVMQLALSQHHSILRGAVAAHHGLVFETAGDSFVAVFKVAPDALNAALHAQRALRLASWPEEIGPLKVRMAVHTGSAEMRPDGYYAQHTLSRLARILSSGYGGQVLLSLATQELVRDQLPPDVELRDLGEHHLKDLTRTERVFQVVTSDLPADFPPLKTLDTHPNNLPRQSTALIGREKETEAVCQLLRRPEVSLVTLTGPGGTGKTRLALQVGAELLRDYEDGVWFVELAALTDHELVASTIARTLGVPEVGGESIVDTLKDALRAKQMLLVLDNFEQVLEAAPLVSLLLKTALRLKVLVTTRVDLRLYGEKEFPVPPLSLPDPRNLPSLERLTQYEAVRLFIERATDSKPDFQVTNENAPAVAEICTRLDGLPLAIELAAARVRLFPPQALLSRLSSRLKVLTGGARDLPARQQTLRGAIEWSYDLLNEEEKQLFRRMAVFHGGRTFEALEAVCNFDGELEIDMIEGVESLVTKSLVQQREASGLSGYPEPRFWMLETIHEYAREKLQENEDAEALHREHALYFMNLVEEAEAQLEGATMAEWLRRLEDEHDNIRAALRWSREKSAASSEAAEIWLRIAGAVWRLWEVRGYLSEGREQLESVSILPFFPSLHAPSSPEVLPTLRVRTAKVLLGAGILAWRQGDYATARSLLEEGLEIQPEGTGLANKKLTASLLHGLGNVAWNQGDYRAARPLYEQSLALRREVGDKMGMAASLNNLGNVTKDQGDYATAGSLYEQSLALRRELADKRGMAMSLNNMAIVVKEQGDYARARALFEDSLALRKEMGDKHGEALTLGNLGIVAKEQGDYAGARSLNQQGLAMHRELGDKWGMSNALLNLGSLEKEQGNYAEATSFYVQSLAWRREAGDKKGVAECLAGLGGVAVARQHPACAARLFGAVERLLEEIGAKLESEDLYPYDRGVASARAQLGEEEFEKLWQEGRAMSMEEAIAYALERSSG